MPNVISENPLRKVTAVRFTNDTYQQLQGISTKGGISRMIRLLVEEHLAKTEVATESKKEN